MDTYKAITYSLYTNTEDLSYKNDIILYLTRTDIETIRISIKKDIPCPFGYGHDLRGCDLIYTNVLVRESNCF